MVTAALAVMIVLGGGTSLAAEAALPGEPLYAVKVEFNEKIKSALALNAEAEARLQTRLATERLLEASELKARGELDAERAEEVRTRMAVHYERAQEESRGANIESEIDTSFEAVFGKYSGTLAHLLNTDTDVTVDEFTIDARTYLAVRAGGLNTGDNSVVTLAHESSDSSSMRKQSAEDMAFDTEGGAEISTMMAIAPIDIRTLFTMTEGRKASLAKVVGESRADVDAELYAKWDDALEASTALIVRAKANNEAETRRLLTEAADVLGQIESDITRMATVSIDTNTGFILNADFSTPPPSEPDRGDGVIDIMPVLPLDGSVSSEADSSIDVTHDVIEVDSSLEVTSEINI
jgi:hypothetical protein